MCKLGGGEGGVVGVLGMSSSEAGEGGTQAEVDIIPIRSELRLRSVGARYMLSQRRM